MLRDRKGIPYCSAPNCRCESPCDAYSLSTREIEMMREEIDERRFQEYEETEEYYRYLEEQDEGPWN